jgi:hypothetical protein
MTDTPHPRAGKPVVDQVPGVPPVPITVWRTPSTDTDHQVSARLAYRIIAAYTQPGDTIIDLTGSPVTEHVAAAGRRVYCRATAGRAGVLRIGEPSAPPESSDSRVADWFDDDATHPAVTTANMTTAAAGDGSATALVLVGWPTPRSHLVAAAVLLRPGGCLVAITAANRAAGGDFTDLVRTAREAGLRYLQHIIAVGADVDADQFVYYATDDEVTHTIGHARIHTDLLVFTAPTADG